jgi:regulator of sigma E protease
MPTEPTSFFAVIWPVVLGVFFFGATIFVHELGHFLAARRRGVHVERFSIGFGPKIFSWRGKDGVEYRLSWFPLGGYVLLPQLADLGPLEGESKADVSKLPPISYATKMIVFVAGAAFNMIFAVILACVVWKIGQPTFAELVTTQIGNLAPTIKLPDGSTVPSPAVEGGLQAGDIVRSIDGKRVTNFEDILTGVFLGKNRTEDGRRKSNFVIERAGKTMELTIYPRLVGEEGIRSAGIEPAEDLTVEKPMAGSPAAAAGVLPGDRIIAVDGQRLFQRSAVSEHLAKNPARPTEFLLRRGDQELTIAVQPRLEFDERTKKQIPRVGIQYRDHIIITHPKPLAQINDNVVGMFRTLEAMLSPSSDIGPSKLTGPIGIVREFHRQAQWDFRRVLWFTILLNVNLAIFNLLPIPVLDGGQMVFATIGRLRGRPLPVNFIMTTQSVFMVLLLSMAIYVSVFDVRRWARDAKVERPEPAAAAQPTPILPPAPADAGK